MSWRSLVHAHARERGQWRAPRHGRRLGAIAVFVVAMTSLLPMLVHAQSQSNARDRWRDPAADSLIQRAATRRSMQLADSTLLSYRADARGFLAFLAQLGEGVIIPPKVVQSEELALTIAWWQPNRSAQQLVGRRDTTLLPADVGYYRDRYGVVLDNLPDRIRLGDGQDVRDVPHPLSPAATALYEYQFAAPVRMRIPGRDIVLDEVRFRPRDGSTPAAIGSVFLDRETAAVVRLSMTFTRAAILDKRIETLVLTLENGLVRERYWLPRRQEVEVSRGSTFLDIPVRGIVRGRWEVSNYEVNERIPAETQMLPRWSSVSSEALKQYPFQGRVVDVLPPEIQIATSDDVARARVQAELAVRTAMLARPARTSLTGRGISDAARVNRAEGVALGLGASRRWGSAWLLSARGRYGLSDEQVKGHLSIGRAPAFGRVPTIQLFAERDYRDVAFAERGGVTNSLAALGFGSDYTLHVDTRAAGLMLRRGPMDPFTVRIAYETDAPVQLTARPLDGVYEPVLPAWTLRGVRTEVRGVGGWVPNASRRTRGTWMVSAAAGGYAGTNDSLSSVSPVVGRIAGMLSVQRDVRNDRAVVSMTHVAFTGGRDMPPQWNNFAGGPWTAPGYAFATFASRAMLSQRLEFRQPVPAPAIPLGRYGKAPGHVTLAPYVQAVAISGVSRIAASLRAANAPVRVDGVYPSAGVGALFFFDLLRVDVARGLRDGQWRFAIDVDRAFWSVM